MEFKQLRSFVEVMHQGGFTQAAKTLHISQSAVSKQIAQLEPVSYTHLTLPTKA